MAAESSLFADSALCRCSADRSSTSSFGKVVKAQVEQSQASDVGSNPDTVKLLFADFFV